MAHVLIVEDDQDDVEALQLVLTELGYSSSKADSFHSARDVALDHRPDLVLMDIHLKGPLDGISAAEYLIAAHNVPVIYLSGSVTPENLERLKRTKPYGCVAKPVKASDLYTTIEIALYKHRAGG